MRNRVDFPAPLTPDSTQTLRLRKESSPVAGDLVRRLEHLNEIGASLSAETDINRLLESILTAAKSITSADGGTLYRVTEDKTKPKRNGRYTLVDFEDEFLFNYARPDINEAELKNILVYFKQAVTAPARLAGSILVVHETLDQVKEKRAGWLYNPGQRRVKADDPRQVRRPRRFLAAALCYLDLL